MTAEATATAIEENRESITTPKLYPLDQTEFEIEILAGKHKLEHKLTKPTLEQLMDRESRSHYETEAINNDEERVSADDEVANARLWDAIATEVRGYRLDKADAFRLNDWRPLTDDIRKAIPATHKAAAIRGMYQFTCELETGGDDEGFTLAASDWTIKQVFGDPDFPAYVVRHILRTPTEQERRDFKRKSSDVRFSKGARKLKTKVVTHLKAHVELYDSLIDHLDGTDFHVADKLKEVAVVDPIWKRSVIDCLMRNFEAGLSD